MSAPPTLNPLHASGGIAVIENMSASGVSLAAVRKRRVKPVRRHDTAVILHLFYSDLWPELSTYLQNLGKSFDLFVTVPPQANLIALRIRADYPQAQVYQCENRGRDIEPFLTILTAIAPLGYKYICKIHSKHSVHIAGGIEWRRDMLASLLGSPGTVSSIKRGLDRNPQWGMIAPKGHVVPHKYYWRLNAPKVKKLAQAAGIPDQERSFLFVAGSMFWFRPEAFRLALEVPFGIMQFESERGQLDGTLAHAWERFFGLAVQAAGFEIAESNGHELGPAAPGFHFALLVEETERQWGDSRITGVAPGGAAVISRLARLPGHLIPRGKIWVAHGIFELKHALDRYFTTRKTILNLRRHRALITSSDLFDASWYLDNNPDVALARVDPAIHYLRFGAFEGRDPGPDFDSKAYTELHPETREQGINPLVHFLSLPGDAASPVLARQNASSTGQGSVPIAPIRRPETDTSRMAPRAASLAQAIRRDFPRLVAYYRYRGMLATARRIWEELRLVRRFRTGRELSNATVVPLGLSQMEYQLARLALSTGALNALWWGGTRLDAWGPASRLWGQSSVEDAVFSSVDAADQASILQRYGHGNGGAPAIGLDALLPLDDLETFLGKVQPHPARLNAQLAPSFSILTPFYEHYQYFRSCAASVLRLIRASPATPIEWIVTNDDPNFSPAEILGAIPQELRSTVRILADGRNLGGTRRLNEAIPLAKHDWLLFLDCDDSIEAQAVNVIASYLTRFPNCRYISSCMADMDDRGRVLRFRRRLQGPHMLMRHGMIAGHLKAVRRDLITEYGGLEEGFDGCQDYDLALRVAFREPLLFIPEYLYYYRYHSATQSIRESTKQTATATAVVYHYAKTFCQTSSSSRDNDGPNGIRGVLTSTQVRGTNGRRQAESTASPKTTGIVIVRTLGNREELLAEAIASISAQGLPMKVVVVVHGDTRAFQDVKRTVNRIEGDIDVLHASDTSRLRGYPINIALERLYGSSADAEFLAFLDDDDVLYPMFASTMVHALRMSNSDLVYAASNRRVLGKPAAPGWTPMPPACLLVQNFIPINSYCVRFSRLKADKPLFDESLPYLEDWDFLVRLFFLGYRFRALGDVLSEFRITGDGNLDMEFKRHPQAWKLSEARVRASIDSLSRKAGRLHLYSQILDFDFGCRPALTEHERRTLRRTRALIDQNCPASSPGYSHASPTPNARLT